MTFTEYLKSKKKLLLWWFIFHSIALFVNICGIEGELSEDMHIFTKKIEHFAYRPDKIPSKHFWPIVKFGDSYTYSDGGGTISWFNGIFYQYDFSEFFAYSLLIFLILYFRWNSKQSSKNST